MPPPLFRSPIPDFRVTVLQITVSFFRFSDTGLFSLAACFPPDAFGCHLHTLQGAFVLPRAAVMLRLMA